jgi:hypothetical protein
MSLCADRKETVMTDFRICQDLEEGRRLWMKHWPLQCIFDFWDLRMCFQKAFERPPFFILAEAKGRIYGLLALSWIEEEGRFGHFPGETWNGKTWLEQNRIIAKDSSVFQGLMDCIPGPAMIRYLTADSLDLSAGAPDPDETGYLFFPDHHEYSYPSYLNGFSGKSRKKIFRELAGLENLGVSFRHNCLKDIDDLFEMNQRSFGEKSYFNDLRFLKSFKNLIDWLQKNGMLTVTSAIIGGKTAAVDIGAVWGSTYMVLAGGTNSDFPGIAKRINLHHIEWACRKRFKSVDFLCGDFGWKNRFHLIPRPLFLIDHASETLPAADADDHLRSSYA